MPEIRVRTRGARAFLQVDCASGADPHRVVATLDGDIEFSGEHNAEHDAVMRALGAPAHPCQRAAQAFRAADTIYRGLIGERDAPDFYANRLRLLRSRNPCLICPRWGSGDIAHFHSCVHQAHIHDTDATATGTLLRWMIRNSPHAARIGGGLRPIIPAAVAAAHGITLRGLSPALGITEAYLAAALAFAPRRANALERTELVRVLRQGGVTVQWLTTLVAHLTESTRQRIRREPVSLVALVGARNIAPEKIARYINAGITANFYTYAKVDARPEDVLTIYRGTERRRTLADDLRGGITIPDAIARIPGERSASA
jgi:hypothetical protein